MKTNLLLSLHRAAGADIGYLCSRTRSRTGSGGSCSGSARGTDSKHRQHHGRSVSSTEQQSPHGVPGHRRRHHHVGSDQPGLCHLAQGGDGRALRPTRPLRALQSQRLGTMLQAARSLRTRQSSSVTRTCSTRWPPPSEMALPANAAELDANGNGEIEQSEATGNFQNNFALFDANEDGMLSGGEIARGPVGDVYPPTDTYSDQRTVTLGGKSVEMIHPGPAHSANMSVVHFPEESAVFVVDFISLGRLPFQTLNGYAHDLWTGEMRDVEALGAEFVIPAHGVVGSTADLAEYRQYHEELYDAVNEGMTAGSSLEELQASITMDAYSDWDNYEQWLPLNIQGMYNAMNQ